MQAFLCRDALNHCVLLLEVFLALAKYNDNSASVEQFLQRYKLYKYIIL